MSRAYINGKKRVVKGNFRVLLGFLPVFWKVTKAHLRTMSTDCSQGDGGYNQEWCLYAGRGLLALPITKVLQTVRRSRAMRKPNVFSPNSWEGDGCPGPTLVTLQAAPLKLCLGGGVRLLWNPSRGKKRE